LGIPPLLVQVNGDFGRFACSRDPVHAANLVVAFRYNIADTRQIACNLANAALNQLFVACMISASRS